MDEQRYLTWPHFARAIGTGVPVSIKVPGDPRVEFLVSASGSEIGMLLPAHDQESVPPFSLTEIQIQKRAVEGTVRFFVSCSSAGFFREFYVFMMSVADEIQLHGKDSLSALTGQVKAWEELLRRTSNLSETEVVGLFGELWLLDRLIKAQGSSALDAWVGPLGEPHDFRLNDYEIEAKTTRNRERIHHIHGLDQLTATAGKRLYILSLQVQPGGQSGSTLSSMIASVRCGLQHDPRRNLAFLDLMTAKMHYNEQQYERYTNSYELRSPPYLVEVDEHCPKLTKDLLGAILPSRIISRLNAVEYQIDLDNLGHPHGSPAFANILPI